MAQPQRSPLPPNMQPRNEYPQPPGGNGAGFPVEQSGSNQGNQSSAGSGNNNNNGNATGPQGQGQGQTQAQGNDPSASSPAATGRYPAPGSQSGGDPQFGGFQGQQQQQQQQQQGQQQQGQPQNSGYPHFAGFPGQGGQQAPTSGSPNPGNNSNPNPHPNAYPQQQGQPGPGPVGMMPGPYATHPYQPPGLAPGSTSGGKSGQEGGDSDHDNRTRNARAQKRHREKRKAHVKGLEEQVAFLQRQVMAIRGPGSAIPEQYPGSNSTPGSSYPFYPPNAGQQTPQQPGVNNGTVHISVSEHRQLTNQNSFLQEEVARLRAENEVMRLRLNERDAQAGGHPKTEDGSNGLGATAGASTGYGQRFEGDQQQQQQQQQQGAGGYPQAGSSQSQPPAVASSRPKAEESPRQQQQQAQPMDESSGSFEPSGQVAAAPGTATYSLNAYAGGNTGEN